MDARTFVCLLALQMRMATMSATLLVSRDVSLDEVCRDTYSDCARLARSMGLQMCPMYGYSLCKKYCRKCRSDLCRDLQPSYVCWKQRALRRCYNPYVSRVCKKKCGFC